MKPASRSLFAASSSLVLTVIVLAMPSAQAGTANNYTGAATGSLLLNTNWSLGTVPTIANDAAFTATTGIRTLSAGNLTVNSFNVTATTGTFTIRNETATATDSILTLGGAGSSSNSTAGAAAGDLLYAVAGSTFNITGPNGGSGTGVLQLALGQSGNFNIAGTSSTPTTISAAISGSGFGITKTGAGALTLSGSNSYTGLTTLSAGTLTLTGDNTAAIGGLTLTTGTLNIASATALGGTAGMFTINGGTLDNNSGSAITNSQNNPLTVGANFTFTGTRDLNLGTGNVTIAATRQITVTNGWSNLTLGGDIQSTAAGLTKVGAGKLILSGTNNYSGVTTVSAGLLQFAKIASLGTGLDAYMTNTNLIASSGAMMAFNVGGGGEFTTANMDTIFGTTGIASGATIGIDTTSGDLAYIPTAIQSGRGIGKLGANTWNFGGTTTGPMVVDNGTLALAAHNPGVTAMRFGAVAASTNAGTLNMSGLNVTTTSLTVQTNSASANTIDIGSGTLTTNGNVSIGANAVGVVTKLNVSGASGAWNVVKDGGTFQLSAASGTVNYDAPTLDMSGLGTFSANLGSTGTMRLGTQTGSGGDAGKATMILATNSTITANLLGIGDTSGSGTNHTFSLGGGNTTLNVNTISVGQTSNSRGWGTLNFNTGTGTVKIRGADGGDTRANLNLRVSTGATNGNMTQTFDVSGHSANLLFDTVNMMDIQQVNNAANVYTSVFKFDTGTLDVTTFKIGTRTGTNAIGTTFPAATVFIGDGVNNYTNTAALGNVTMATNSNTGAGSGIAGTLNIAGSNTTVNLNSLTIASNTAASGSSASTGTVNISGGTVTNVGGIVLASRTGAGTGATSGTLNLTGGSLTVGGNITTTGTVTSNLTLNGGTLNMSGSAIGAIGQAITANFQSGTLQNLAELNGGGTLTKSGGGTLVIEGTNNYTGPTTVSSGTLVVNGSTTGTGAVSVAGTLGGTGSVAGPVTIESGGSIAPGTSTGNLTVASAAFNTTSTFAIEVNDAANPKADSLTVTGALDLTGATLALTVTGSPAQAAYVIASYPAGQLTGTFTGLAQGAAVPGMSGYTIDYAYNSGTRIALVQSGTPAGFAGWIATPAFGLAVADRDPGDDPDQDGMENLLEFVLNGKPSISDPEIMPDLNVTDTDFEFTYQRRDDSISPETTQTFEWGTALDSWPNSIAVPAASGPAGVATVTVTAGVPDNAVTDSVKVSIPKTEAGAAAKLFGRLKVTKP